MNKNLALAFESVTFSYTNQKILDEVTLHVEHGEFLALIGPNGGGKSTLIKLALGLIKIDQGELRVLDASPERARVSVGYVPQFASFRRDFPITVFEAVMHGRLGRKKWWQKFDTFDKQATHSALEATGVASMARQPIASLSGGQLQRMLISRALASEPKLLLLDEPTAHVDTTSEHSLFDLLAKLRGKTTIVIVSHDVGVVSRHVDRVACLNRRLICHAPLPLQAGLLESLYADQVSLVDHHHNLA